MDSHTPVIRVRDEELVGRNDRGLEVTENLQTGTLALNSLSLRTKLLT
jgi:hypothetical protein